MSLQHAKSWHSEKALVHLAKAPSDWPCEIHKQLNFSKGPSTTWLQDFINASALRSRLVRVFNPGSDAMQREEFSMTLEGIFFFFLSFFFYCFVECFPD